MNFRFMVSSREYQYVVLRVRVSVRVVVCIRIKFRSPQYFGFSVMFRAHRILELGLDLGTEHNNI